MQPADVYRKPPPCLGMTIATALVSLAFGRLASQSVVIMGDLRLDGARIKWVDGLTKPVLEWCLEKGIRKLVVGPKQVSLVKQYWFWDLSKVKEALMMKVFGFGCDAGRGP